MVPRITSKGKSFKGAGAYFLHDLGKAQTAERVEFTHTVNMLTDDPDKAIKVMTWTAEHAQELKEISGQKTTGRKAENPVYTYCLAWAPDQDPTREEMTALGMRSMEVLGVGRHEALFVAHNDTPHKHLHVILNRVDPETGLMAKMSHDRNLLSRLAQAYEEETGRVYCAQRVENNRRRDLGERNVKAAEVGRLAETSDYQARRAARIQAQRQAGALALEKQRADQVKGVVARDLRAAFDRAAGTDDRQYRAKEIERPSIEERRESGAAWADERATQQAKAKAAQDQARIERQEKARRAALDARRAQEWDAYEARQWQGLNDRQTTRREALHEAHAGAVAAFDARLGRKYAVSEQVLERRREAAAAVLETGGVRQVMDRLTGKHAKAAADLEALGLATKRLQEQKDREREAFSAKLAKQRDADRARQELERQRLAERLRATKARQNAKFEEQEVSRVRRFAAVDHGASTAADQVREARRQAVRKQIALANSEREDRVEQARSLDLRR